MTTWIKHSGICSMRRALANAVHKKHQGGGL
jgi:hypothetical protein